MRPGEPNGLPETLDKTLGEANEDVAKMLKDAGIDSARLDARLIVSFAAGLEPSAVLIRGGLRLDDQCCDKIQAMTNRRINHEPISHILGRREFWSLDFKVNAHTLIPRPDTETLVEAVLSRVDGRSLRILDLGTGSGCILLSLLSELPECQGLGIDISQAALSIAQENAHGLGLSERARFAVGQWASHINQAFDVVVSNPPYIPSGDMADLMPEVSKFEPRQALDGGVDGLVAYRHIARDLRRLLNPAGLVFFEIGVGQATHVTQILQDNGLGNIEIIADLSGIPRVVTGKASF